MLNFYIEFHHVSLNLGRNNIFLNVLGCDDVLILTNNNR